MAREPREAAPTYPVQLTAPRVPGETPSVVWQGQSVEGARAAAAHYAGRADLRRQDVRVETASGKTIEYAGPAR